MKSEPARCYDDGDGERRRFHVAGRIDAGHILQVIAMVVAGTSTARTRSRIADPLEGICFGPSETKELAYLKTRNVNPSPVPQNVVIDGKRTTLRLEDEMWDALREISIERNLSIDELIALIKSSHTEANLSAGIRVYIVMHYRRKA